MSTIKIVCQNKKARHDFYIEETFEAGLVLQGTEVKSLREGKANLIDAYATIQEGEAWLHHCHINPYTPAHQYNHPPLRTRKLLLHQKEIARLIGKTREKGYTLIPLKLYFKNGKAKAELALARSKKKHDKRAAIKAREAQREIDKALKSRPR
ncbi:MAG: SsrA-binding protein SmpB [Nitrospinaceae bacterium]|nr:SsrA-binding protein SmpB [Nitrospinaceae bacterium]NIR57087.1 SsrA-binding protein SmpB [Nitrospinaceae bacterium]NIS87528.1 SsrA-binding protein SmpB [Nitrospinaceae bacterium]NIT84398.1 SsrA-binding protein SmpB [Nitrospinaceae bacterium]NIU46585.1 SsrA-binding protein SmpB [Nitrospinaceae bacterium]